MAVCVYDPRTKAAKRVSKDEAEKLVRSGWKYIGKAEWQRIVSRQTTAPTG